MNDVSERKQIWQNGKALANAGREDVFSSASGGRTASVRKRATRTRNLTLRVTEEEYAEIQEEARESGITVTEWHRMAVSRQRERGNAMPEDRASAIHLRLTILRDEAEIRAGRGPVPTLEEYWAMCEEARGE